VAAFLSEQHAIRQPLLTNKLQKLHAICTIREAAAIIRLKNLRLPFMMTTTLLTVTILSAVSYLRSQWCFPVFRWSLSFQL
jgi:hypothetical protein